MALTVPTNKLSTQTVSASFDQLLYLDAASGLVEATLKVVGTDSGKSAVQLDDERLLVQGVDTSNAAAFEVKNTGGTSVFKVNASTPGAVLTGNGTKLYFYDAGGEYISADASGVLSIAGGAEIDLASVIIDINATTTCTIDNTNTSNGVVINAVTSGGPISIGHTTSETTVNDNLTITGDLTSNGAAVFNEGGSADYDFRVETDGEDEAFFIDSSANTVYINKGETGFVTSINNTNDVALVVGNAGVVLNEDAHATNDFRVESDGESHMLFVDSGANGVAIGAGGATYPPMNVLDVYHNSGDGNDGIQVVFSGNVTDGVALGGIGFDSTDGAVPSSILESSAYIAAYGAETHSVNNQGGDLAFGTAPNGQDDDTVSTERMRILDSGNVGIGTVAPSALLHLARAQTATSADIMQKIVLSGNTIDTTDVLLNLDFAGDSNVAGAYYIQFEDNDGEIGSIKSADDAVVAFNTTSDYRLKEDFKDIVDATGTINKLKLYNFKWKRNGNRSHGIVAHEVAEVYSQPVDGEKDAMTTKDIYYMEGDDIPEGKQLGEVKGKKDVIHPQSVDYSKFVPLLLKSIQELSAEVEKLKGDA